MSADSTAALETQGTVFFERPNSYMEERERAQIILCIAQRAAAGKRATSLEAMVAASFVAESVHLVGGGRAKTPLVPGLKNLFEKLVFQVGPMTVIMPFSTDQTQLSRSTVNEMTKVEHKYTVTCKSGHHDSRSRCQMKVSATDAKTRAQIGQNNHRRGAAQYQGRVMAHAANFFPTEIFN